MFYYIEHIDYLMCQKGLKKNTIKQKIFSFYKTNEWLLLENKLTQLILNHQTLYQKIIEFLIFLGYLILLKKKIDIDELKLFF